MITMASSLFWCCFSEILFLLREGSGRGGGGGGCKCVLNNCYNDGTAYMKSKCWMDFLYRDLTFYLKYKFDKIAKEKF